MKLRRHIVFEEICHDFQSALLNMANNGNKNAYNYLVQERNIHPQVVVDYMLGVVPSGYDINAKFKHIIEEAEAAVESVKLDSKNKGRSKKIKGYTPEERLKHHLDTKQAFKMYH